MNSAYHIICHAKQGPQLLANTFITIFSLSPSLLLSHSFTSAPRYHHELRTLTVPTGRIQQNQQQVRPSILAPQSQRAKTKSRQNGHSSVAAPLRNHQKDQIKNTTTKMAPNLPRSQRAKRTYALPHTAFYIQRAPGSAPGSRPSRRTPSAPHHALHTSIHPCRSTEQSVQPHMVGKSPECRLSLELL